MKSLEMEGEIKMKYLAYGSNMDEGIMRSRCAKAEFLGTGILQDFRLMFKGEEPNAYATIEEWQGYSVPYVLWEITEEDEKELARFEGFPYNYQKQSVEIEFDDENYWATFYAKSDEEKVGQPMTHYVDVLENAYDKYKFDERILEEALRLSNEYYQHMRG